VATVAASCPDHPRPALTYRQPPSLLRLIAYSSPLVTAPGTTRHPPARPFAPPSSPRSHPSCQSSTTPSKEHTDLPCPQAAMALSRARVSNAAPPPISRCRGDTRSRRPVRSGSGLCGPLGPRLEESGVQPVGPGAEALMSSLAAHAEGIADVLPRDTVLVACVDDLDPGKPIGRSRQRQGGDSEVQMRRAAPGGKDLADGSLHDSINACRVRGTSAGHDRKVPCL
jgi:hypothetical protein